MPPWPWCSVFVSLSSERHTQDGRVGFIDFGIVGRIPQTIWGALQETAVGFASKDFGLMAQALVNMGAADDKVDVQAFAADLERVIVSLESIEPEVVVRGWFQVPR